MFGLFGDSVMIADTEGRIVYVNAAFEALTGYTRDDAAGQNCNLLKSGTHPRQLYHDLWSALRAHKAFRTIFTNRRKNGELYEEGVIISPVLGQDGAAQYYVSVGREINALRQTFDAFLVLANNSPAGVYILRNGRIAFANAEVAAYTGTSMQEMVDQTWEEFIHADDRERTRRESQEMLAGNHERPIEFRLVQPDGAIRWVMQTVRPIEFRERRFRGVNVVCGNLVDITDRHVAEERLRGALSLQRATVEATTDGILVTGTGGQVVSSNQRFREIWNLQHFVGADASASAIYQAMQAQMAEPAELVDAMKRLTATSDAAETVSVELLDGRVLELFSNAFVVDGTPQGRVWSWRDVTERRRFEMALLQLANHDALTGLINRRRLQELIAAATTVKFSSGALLLLDLDRFKEVNDSLGHQAGDEVLIRVGGTLRKVLPGQYVARFGGDEFAVFMPSATAATARQAATKVIDAIESGGYSARGIDVGVTASIGIALCPAHGTSPDELLANADVAMYAAKAAGRNRYRMYSQTVHRRASLETRRQMQAELQEAIEAERWKLYTRPAICLTHTGPTLHRLQPRFTRANGTVLPDAEHGSLSEHAGLLKGLDRWMIAEAGRTLKVISAGGGRAVSIALPWQTLADRDMLRVMRQTMDADMVEDASIFVEVADLDSLQETRSLAKTMDGLRSCGYRFALAVTAGSQLTRLVSALPVDLVRVQQALVTDAIQDQFALDLLTNLVRALHGIGIGTMADQVNNKALFDLLQEAGVDYVRGSQAGGLKLASTLLRQLQAPPKAA